MAVSARREVFRLYKRLLRLHERLPADFGTLGRRFVQEEFKKHKDVSQEQAGMFIKEWTVSARLMSTKLMSTKLCHGCAFLSYVQIVVECFVVVPQTITPPSP